MNSKWMNNHHRIPKSREKDGYDVHHEDNQWLMNQKKHECIHNLFQNLCPHEQFDELLRINKQVMNAQAIKLIKQALDIDTFYKQHLLTDGKDKNRRSKKKPTVSRVG